MKKVLSLVFAFTLSLGIFGCGSSETDRNEIAMITDVGNIDDKSFNQGTWEGVVAYAQKNAKSYKYFNPAKQSTEGYLAAIKLAVEGGAKVVITPGFLFVEPITLAQDLYPEVNFILVDGAPTTINSNTLSIIFAEEEAGYLAGYAAVMDGHTKLGFIGGVAVPAVVRYGYGFAQGAEAAAVELGIAKIDLKYHYAGGFEATPKIEALAASWYTDGTEVIFACGGNIGKSAMSAAKMSTNAKVIGVDVDQSSESPTVITSAMKSLALSVENALTDHFNGNFNGGKSLVYDASKNGVGLAMSSAKFSKFNKNDYDKVFTKLAAGEIVLQKDKDVDSADKLALLRVKVALVD